MKRRTAAALALLALAAGPAPAGDYVDRMNTPFPIPAAHRLMNDYEDVLRAPRRIALEKRLQELERKNGTQIVFLSVPNAGPMGLQAYAEAVFKQWNIGNNGQNNGVLFLVTYGDAGILRGPGMAGALPDVLLGRVRRKLLKPAYERTDVAELADLSDSIEQTLDALIKASMNEDTLPTAHDYRHPVDVSEADVLTPERAWIGALSAAFAVYAGMLVRRRLRPAARTRPAS